MNNTNIMIYLQLKPRFQLRLDKAKKVFLVNKRIRFPHPQSITHIVKGTFNIMQKNNKKAQKDLSSHQADK
jgi:hypothetical protein